MVYLLPELYGSAPPFWDAALLPSAVFAQQFTPQQMLDVITKSPNNRDVRVQDAAIAIPMYEDLTVNDEESELRALLQQLRNDATAEQGLIEGEGKN